MEKPGDAESSKPRIGEDPRDNNDGVEGNKNEPLSIVVDKSDDVGIGEGIDNESGEHEEIQDNDSEGNNDGDLGTTVDNGKGVEGSKYVEENTENIKGSDSEEDEGDLSYPDTSIDFQYTSGGKFQLQRGASTSSSQATEDFVDLGDGEVLDLRSVGKDGETRKQRLSAKQRRQMKKKGGSGVLNDKNNVETQENVSSDPGPKANKHESDSGKTKQPVTQQNVTKRGKKLKLKKIKEKYGDQDEEDRELMMQFLGSAGAPKENKRKKGKDTKGRKGSAQNTQGERRVNKDISKGGAVKNPLGHNKIEDKQSEPQPAKSGEALENVAGDLVRALPKDNASEQQEIEVKVLISRACFTNFQILLGLLL